MVLYILLILMTKRHLFIGLWIIAIGITAIVYSVLPKTTEAKKELSDYDVCYWSGYTFELQVVACWNVIKKEQRNYPRQEEKLKAIAESANNARNQISKIAKDFYSENLSGTNVDFQ